MFSPLVQTAENIGSSVFTWRDTYKHPLRTASQAPERDSLFNVSLLPCFTQVIISGSSYSSICVLRRSSVCPDKVHRVRPVYLVDPVSVLYDELQLAFISRLSGHIRATGHSQP